MYIKIYIYNFILQSLDEKVMITDLQFQINDDFI